MAFIRQSKVRHVFGETPRKEMCYEGFRVTNCAFEGTFIAANAKFVASCIEVGGGGAFIVVPVGKVSYFSLISHLKSEFLCLLSKDRNHTAKGWTQI